MQPEKYDNIANILNYTYGGRRYRKYLYTYITIHQRKTPRIVLSTNYMLDWQKEILTKILIREKECIYVFNSTLYTKKELINEYPILSIIKMTNIKINVEGLPVEYICDDYIFVLNDVTYLKNAINPIKNEIKTVERDHTSEEIIKKILLMYDMVYN